MQGELVFLRALEEDDLVTVRKWNFDAEISRYFSSRFPVSMEEQKKWYTHQYNSETKKRLIICDKKTEQMIGLVGFMQIDHLNRNCEIGITIGETAYWGQPHGGEALRLALKFLFKDYNMHLVYLKVFENNTRAIKFFQKNRFVQNGILRDMIFWEGKYVSWVWMSIRFDEWQKNQE